MHTKIYNAMCLCLFLGCIGCGESVVEQQETKSDTAPAKKDTEATSAATHNTETKLIPHLEEPIKPNVNYVFCGTAKVAYDLLPGPVPNANGKSMAEAIERLNFKEEDLPEGSYHVGVGKLQDLGQQLRAKYPEARFNVPNIELPGDHTAAIAYLQRNLPFEHYFKKQPPMLFQSGKEKLQVKNFGLLDFAPRGSGHADYAKQVSIIDYVNENDIILELLAKSKKDHLIIANIPPHATMQETLASVKQRVANRYAPQDERSRLMEKDNLLVPNINCNVNARWQFSAIDQLHQAVYFKLNEKGAEIESLAVRVIYEAEEAQHKPRNFIVNKPFMIYVEKEESQHPYIVAWVANAGLLEMHGQKIIKAKIDNATGIWKGSDRNSNVELNLRDDGTVTFIRVSRQTRSTERTGTWKLDENNIVEIQIGQINMENARLQADVISAEIEDDKMEGTITQKYYMSEQRVRESSNRFIAKKEAEIRTPESPTTP